MCEISMTENIKITRVTPQFLVFLVDESESMKGLEKSNEMKNTLNQLIADLIERSLDISGFRNYFYVSIFGYGGDIGKDAAIRDLFNCKENAPDEVKSASIRSIKQIFQFGKTKETPDGIESDRVKFRAEGLTPMKEAFSRAGDLIKRWHDEAEDIILDANPQLSSIGKRFPPPIIINITDGRYDNIKSGEPDELDETRSPEQEIRKITADERYNDLFDAPVVMNIHLNSSPKSENIETAVKLPFPMEKPDVKEDPYVAKLWELSSYLTPTMLTSLSNYGDFTDVTPFDKRKAFMYNASSSELLALLLVGTGSATRPSITLIRETPVKRA